MYELNKYLVVALATIIAVPLIALIFALPAWFLGGHKQIQVELVTAFLTFDGIMVAATAFFTPLKPNYFGRSVLAISTEFVASAAGFLLSLRGIIDTPSSLVHVGTSITGGLVLMFGGLISLFVLMIGTYLGFLFQNPTVASGSQKANTAAEQKAQPAQPEVKPMGNQVGDRP